MLDKMLKSPSVWEKLKDADLPIVCYGTGNGADKIFDEFERAATAEWRAFLQDFPLRKGQEQTSSDL